jgi:hypothetical protein
MNSRAAKIVAGIFIIGIGTYFLGQALIKYDANQRCIERRNFIESLGGVKPDSIQLECKDTFSSLFVIAAGIKAIGVMVLLFGLLDVSIMSLRRENASSEF